MTERKHERVHTRKIDRAVARQRMKEDGVEHINKKSYTAYTTISGAVFQKVEPSYFAKNWRRYDD